MQVLFDFRQGVRSVFSKKEKERRIKAKKEVNKIRQEKKNSQEENKEIERKTANKLYISI